MNSESGLRERWVSPWLYKGDVVGVLEDSFWGAVS